MINPRISALWSTTKPIEAFSCTQVVQAVHTKAVVLHFNNTPKYRRPGGKVYTSALVCTFCTPGVQENAVIGLVVLQSAEILGLIICFALHFLCETIE